MDGGEEISRGFVVARGNGTELFELTEKILDQVALFVEVPVEIEHGPAVVSGRDDGRLTSRGQRFANPGIGITSAS
jgi:hypothetical protein